MRENKVREIAIHVTQQCNLNCKHCICGDEIVFTEDGVKSVGSVNVGDKIYDGDNFRVVTDKIEHYVNGIYEVKPRRLPKIKLSKGHELYVCRNGEEKKVPVEKIKEGDRLIIPKPKVKNEITEIDLKNFLPSNVGVGIYLRKIDEKKYKNLKSEIDKKSKELGKKYDLHPHYIRRIRKEIRNNSYKEFLKNREKNIKLEYDDEKVWYTFSKTKCNRHILDLKKLARLLGYYTADGSLYKLKDRKNSYCLRVCYGKHDTKLLKHCKRLFEEVFDIDVKIAEEATTNNVVVYNSAVSLLFKKLCGQGAENKKAPLDLLLKTNKEVIEEYISGCILGDGWFNKKNNRTRYVTISKKLAYSLFYLYLSIDYTGHIPTLNFGKSYGGSIDGRKIKDGTRYAIGVQYFTKGKRRFYQYETKQDKILVKLEGKKYKKTKKKVYDFTVDQTHRFIVNNILSSNCYVKPQKGDMAKSLSKDDLHRIYSLFKPEKTVLIGGEPLLYENLEEALALFDNITISTNGLLIPEKAELLKQFDVNFLQISIEGKKKYNDCIRGEGTYDKAVEAGKTAKEYNLSCYFRVGYCRQNLGDIKWLLDNLSDETGIPLALMPRIDKPPLPVRDQMALFDMVTSKGNGSVIAQPHFWQYLGKNGTCNAADERLNITYNGRITPCHMDWEYTLGDIHDSLESINGMRRTWLESRSLNDKCLRCPRADVCKGGCYVSKAYIGCPLRQNFTLDSYVSMHGDVDMKNLSQKVESMTDLVKEAQIC